MDFYQAQPLTLNFSVPVLAAGTTTTVSTTNAINYCIKGKAYTKGALTNAATPTTDAVTGNAFNSISKSQGCAFVFMLDKSGNLKVAQGSIWGLDTANAFVTDPLYPTIPDTMCPFGHLIVLAATTLVGTWTFGTNNNSSVTGMTYNFADLAGGIPDRPQSS